MYTYVQQTIDYVDREIAFCEASNTDAQFELDYSRAYTINANNRTARQAGWPEQGAAGGGDAENAVPQQEVNQQCGAAGEQQPQAGAEVAPVSEQQPPTGG